MHVQLADQSICRVEGIAYDIYVWVGCSYVPVDFVVLDTSHDPRAPIILDVLSWVLLKPSSMLTVQKYALLSKIERRDSLLNLPNCNLLTCHRYNLQFKKLKARRRISLKKQGRSRPHSQCKIRMNLLEWFLHFDPTTNISLFHHSTLRREI
jgi:hypothetical protein